MNLADMVVLVFLLLLVVLSVSLAKGDDTQDTTSGVENELPKNPTVIILAEPGIEGNREEESKDTAEDSDSCNRRVKRLNLFGFRKVVKDKKYNCNCAGYKYAYRYPLGDNVPCSVSWAWNNELRGRWARFWCHLCFSCLL